MSSAEERDGQDPNRIRELLAEMNRGGRPPERSDRADEKAALEERLDALKEEYGDIERNALIKARQGGYSAETMLRMAVYKLGMTEDSVRPPIYRDDIPHR